jgi:hypothetical protein
MVSLVGTYGYGIAEQSNPDSRSRPLTTLSPSAGMTSTLPGGDRTPDVRPHLVLSIEHQLPGIPRYRRAMVVAGSACCGGFDLDLELWKGQPSYPEKR